MRTPVTVLNTVLAVALASLSGCTAWRGSVGATAPSKAPAITARCDQADLLTWGQVAAETILSHPFPPAGESQPILVDMGIQNRASTHIDTKAITDTITTKLMDSGKVRLANATRRDELLKEQGCQLANCTEQTRVQIGKQLGAKYMLTGSLVEISRQSPRQARVSKQEDVSYQLTVEITDLETGLVVVRKQPDRMRTATRPIIGR